MTYFFKSWTERYFSIFLLLSYAGSLNLGSRPGCAGERKSGSELVGEGGGMGRVEARRGVMECSGLERQAN